MNPLMGTKGTAAAPSSMGVATYSKLARQHLLPPTNSAGRTSIPALMKAVLRLDGIEPSGVKDPDEAALTQWEAEVGED